LSSSFSLRFANIIFCIAASFFCIAQPKHYSTANAHSHNDYENPVPFYTAYNAQFGSIEADIFLEHGKLFVAHDTTELKQHRTLKAWYLDPLLNAVRKHNGYAYADSAAPLQMLIDIKTDSIHTLDVLINLLKHFPELISGKINWVITGSRPAAELFTHYPSFIFFDGRSDVTYNEEEMTHIAMMSADLKNYASWTGQGMIPLQEKRILKKEIDKVHRVHKHIRFWDAPDTMRAWQELMRLGVDYINTDHIRELAKFLQKK